ncbi:MAG: GNAT family N-acetyltransferase [Xanthobacteraceae bacterium]
MNTMSLDSQSLTFRELQCGPDDLAILERFYQEIYVPEFPSRDERESLQNMINYLRLKANGWYGRNNYHILVGFYDGNPIAGSFVDYLDEPNSGVIEFLVVSRALRGTGCGRQLLDETEKRVANDAMLLGKGSLDAIVAEMNDPYKQTKDSMDAFIRAAIWDGWGYRRLDFPYVQPALAKDKARVDDLLLIAKPCRREFERALPAAKVKAVLRGYMRWAMRIERPEATPEYQSMSRYLDAAETVPLSGLSAYTGRDAARPFTIHEIAGPADPELAAGLLIYARAFPGGRTDISADDFRTALSRAGSNAREMRYHFWAIRSRHDTTVEGMASFFTFPDAGFGGYIALDGSLRHSGRFPLLLARVEERMIRDAIGANGWYIECNPKQEPLFARHGFHTVDLAYAQPPLPGGPPYSPNEAPPLRLMYKAFGRSFAPPALAVRTFRETMARIFHAVYGLENVLQSPFYVHLCEQVARWPGGRVRFRPAAS